MKRRVCWFLLFLTLGFFVFGQVFSVLMPVSAVSISISPSASDDPTLPPIIPPNTNYTVIGETVDIEQDVEVQSNSVLFLKNAELNVKKRFAKITFTDSRLQAINSTLTSSRGVYFDVCFNGSSSASADRLTMEKGGRLHAYDSSELTILTSKMEGTVTAYDSSTVSISDGKIEGMVTAYDSSTVSISNVGVMLKLYAKGSSFVSISDCSVMEKLYAFDSSTVSMDSVTIIYHSILGVESGLNSFDYSRVIVSKSNVEWMRTFNSSYVSMFDTTLKGMGMHCYDTSIVFISRGRIEGIDFITHDFSLVTIVNSLIAIDKAGRAASLVAYDSSKVWIDNTRVKGSLSARGSSDMHIENSKEVWLLSTSDSSVTFVYNSNVTLLRTHDSSVTSISESPTKLLRAYDSSTVSVSKSTVKELFIYCSSVNCSIADLAPSSFKDWNFWLESLVVVAPRGYAPDVTLKETRIQQGWGFSLFDSSNVTISDSTLEYLGLSGSSVVRLISSTVIYPYILSEAKVYVNWYLDVHVVSGANVTVLHPDGTVADYKWNITNGLVRFTLFEKVLDVSGTYPSDTYTVKAVSNGYSDQQSLKMTGNKSVTMTPPLPLWQQYWYAIIAFVVVAAALAIISLRVRKRKLT